MMYPRLKLLHRLLSEDGVIFISIDFHEQPFLRLILEEIFGRDNYVSEIACVNKPSGRSDDKYVATAHESIIIFRKTDKMKLGGFEPDETIIKRYTKTDSNDGRLYREEDLRKRGTHDERNDRPNLFYPFFYNTTTNDLIIGNNEDATPDNYIRIEPMKDENTEGTWRWEKRTAIKDKYYLHPRFMPNKGQWSIFEWQYLDERGSVKPTTVWNFKDVNSERGTETFSKFLGFDKSLFPNPKPVGTIERVIQIATDKDSIILDSFGGSGTTAHAVLNINKKDDGNRKFILVEMLDYAETLTAERTRRVINGYGEGKNVIEGTGGGFTFYELGDTMLNGDYLNESVGTDKIREYIYFTETKQVAESKEDEPHYLGSYIDTAYYFYYDKENVTTLDRDFLHTIKTKSAHYVIYADKCILSDTELEKYNITFKKIPRDITRL